jgi:MPBQ/MSBQ methyltransferase
MRGVPTEVVEHLRREYRGVFSDRQLERHLDDHLLLGGSRPLADLVLDRTSGGRVLDVGCGYGSFVAAGHQSGLAAIGIDLSEFELGFAHQRSDYIEMPVARANATRLPFPDSAFDVVTLWNVLEHLPDAAAALTEVRRVLRPGGHLFVLAPNYTAFRNEAHYHVPWFPFLGRRSGSAWLRLWQRDPTFWQTAIFPCSATATTRFLKHLGFNVEDYLAAKLNDPEAIGSNWKRRAVQAAARTGILSPLRAGLALRTRNPLRGSLTLHAVLGGDFSAPAKDEAFHR